MRVLAALLVAFALLAPAAVAQDTPFDNQLPPAQPTPAPTIEPVDTSSDDDIGRETMFAIGGALLIGLFAIGWWISRDARSNLPADEREDRRGQRDQGPHRHEKEAKAKARAKARAQRQARKTGRKKAKR